MKRISFLVVLMGLFLLASTASTDFLGVKKSTETVSFFLNDPLDSTGVARKPDSAHVLTYADNASAATFTATSTTYPFSDISIDTLKIYGDTIYVFSDAIADIDGGGGNFQLAIEVKLFCNTLPTPTHATVQITADSLNVLATINDSLEAYDGWVATSAKQTLVIDTVNAVLDTLQSQDGWVGTSAKQTLVIDTVNAILDTLQEWDDEIGLVTAMRDTINATLDTLQNQDDWVATAAILDDVVDTVRLIEGDVDDILDTLKSHDDWVATAAILDDVIDTVRLIEGDVDDILDTLKNQDDWVSSFDVTSDFVIIQDTMETGDSVAVMPDFWSAADSTAFQGDVSAVGDVADTVNAILDTLQNQDDWVSSFDVSTEFVIIQDTMETGDSVAVMPDFWSAADSAGYQGAAAGLTKADIADTVWKKFTDGSNENEFKASGFAVAGDAMALTTAERGHVEDSIYARKADYKATGYAVAGDAMTLTTGERGSIEDSIYARKADYKATGYAVAGDAMALTTAERGSIEDSVYAQRAGYKADVSALALDADITTLQTSVTDAASDIDSLSWWLGAEIGCYSYTHLNTGADTMWIVNDSDDTLSLFIFFHPGGAAGDPPDSFKVVAP